MLVEHARVVGWEPGWQGSLPLALVSRLGFGLPSGRRVLFEALHGLGMGLSYRAGPGAVVVWKERSSTNGVVVCPCLHNTAQM